MSQENLEKCPAFSLADGKPFCNQYSEFMPERSGKPLRSLLCRVNDVSPNCERLTAEVMPCPECDSRKVTSVTEDTAFSVHYSKFTTFHKCFDCGKEWSDSSPAELT